MLEVYEIEYKKHLLNLKKEKVDLRIKELEREKMDGGVVANDKINDSQQIANSHDKN